jgi:hypothetical protein
MFFVFLTFVSALSCSVYISIVLRSLYFNSRCNETQYLWLNFKLYFNITSMLVSGYPGTLGTPMYVFIVEFPQPVGRRHTSCTQLLWKPRDQSREDTPIYLVTFENSRSMEQGALHVRSYCGNPAIQAGKAHAFPLLQRKPEECICLCIIIS